MHERRKFVRDVTAWRAQNCTQKKKEQMQNTYTRVKYSIKLTLTLLSKNCTEIAHYASSYLKLIGNTLRCIS